MSNYIRFDWAMKRLLRNKANFAVLEGFLTTLLRDRIKIQKLLESESNQEEEFDKYNRVDLLAEDSKGTLLLIEIQNNNEYAYFQRMLLGTSKLVTEYINRGEGYDKVRKVYNLNTGEIPDQAQAPGLNAARERLKLDRMSKDELKAYYRHLDNIVILRDNINTERAEGRAEGLEAGRLEERRQNAIRMKAKGFPAQDIADITGLSPEEIDRL